MNNPSSSRSGTLIRRDSHSSISDYEYFAWAVACLGALLAMRIIAVNVSATDLVMDEAQYWTWSQDLAFGYFSKPPLIAWVIRGMTELCGPSEACIRSASPILYTATALMLFASARALFDARIGFWSAIVFATLPGVSYSSNLITTDVPLIFVWSVMLYFWVMLVKHKSIGFALLFGAAIGIGLLAKQAMIYAVLCAACHAAVSRDAREALGGGRGIVAALVAFALFLPNIIWNAQNDFPMVRHTGTNIGWSFPYIHPLRIILYIGSQFAVFGPILLVVLARRAWCEIRNPRDNNKILLLSFSLPILALLLIQALLSRAHGNWSGTAYPAATIFVTAVMLQLNRKVLFRVSLALHLAFAAILATVPAFARQWPVFEQVKFLRTTLGWNDVANVVRTKLAEHRYGAILVHKRNMAAAMLYYLRDAGVPLVAWAPGPVPHDHYEMTRPFTADTPAPILLVSLQPCPPEITLQFGNVTPLGAIRVPLVDARARIVYFCKLSGYGNERKTRSD